MKRTISIFLILVIVLSNIAFAADEQFGEEFQDTVNKIKEASDKLNELVDAYKEMKLDFIKTEDVTVKDQDGNGVSCELEAYYDSDYVSDLTTSADGTYKGNFNHRQRYPGKLISYRLSGCKCRIVNVNHQVSFPSFDEHINRLKQLLSDELQKWGEDKGKEIAEETVKKGFDAAGAGELAGPFLAGFKVGADLGAPFGEALTKGLNDMLELSVNQNKWKREALKGDSGALEPANYRRITARWWDFGRTAPMIANKWDITVKCDPRYSSSVADATWTAPPKKPKTVTGTQTGTQTGTTPQTPSTTGTTPTNQGYDEQQRRDEQRRADEERSRREAEAKRIAEEKAKREAELQKAEEEVRTKCKICDPLVQQINDLSNSIADKEAQSIDLNSQADQAKADAEKAERDLKNAQEALNQFDNPSSWAESNGRRITSSDLAIDRMVSQENWQRYADGEQSAQETSNNWRDYNDAQRAEAKARYKESLEAKIDAAKAVSDAKASDANAKQAAAAKARSELVSLKRQLDALKKQLEDCLKKCKENARQIAENPQMGYQELTQPTQVASGPCQRYEKLLSRYQLTPARYESADEETLTKLEISSSMKDAIESERRNCNPTVRTTGTTRTYTPQVATSPQVTTGTQPPATMSCSDLCASKGMTTEQKDWSSYVLSTLNSQGVCAKSATMDFGSYLRSGSCICYPTGEPSIQISGEKLACNSQCGVVPCGSSTECSCGERCTLKVECRWGGWKKLSAQQYVPTVAVSTA